MVQEVEIPSVKEVPASTATEEGLAPTETVDKPSSEEPQEPAPEAEAPETDKTEEAPSFDPSRYENDETFKSFLDDKVVEARREGQKRERGRRAEVLQMHQANGQVVGQLNQSVESLFHRINKAVEDGMDSDGIVRALQQHAPHLVNFAQWNQSLVQQFRAAGGQETAGKFFTRLAEETTGKADWVEKIVGQLNEDWQYDGGAEAFDNLVSEIKKRLTGPDKKRIAALEVELERYRLADRQNGPDSVQKAGAGGRTYSQMSPEERQKLTPQQRDALVKQEMGWQ